MSKASHVCVAPIVTMSITAFIHAMQAEGYQRFISLTRNPRLLQLFLQLGFVEGSRSEYRQRQSDSPEVPMFFKEAGAAESPAPKF